ncbi:MAG: hypothetical protein NC483_00460 [Ruminococcus sp.]|nr:hypothetical protein [Ruminococcus sp.]
MDKIFKFELIEKSNCCNFCEEKAIVNAEIILGNTTHTFSLCKTHFENFKNEVNESYDKTKSYFEFENKKKELFN